MSTKYKFYDPVGLYFVTTVVVPLFIAQVFLTCAVKNIVIGIVYYIEEQESEVGLYPHNPVVAGWVNESEEYLYSSARNYAGLLSRIKAISICDGAILSSKGMAQVQNT